MDYIPKTDSGFDDWSRNFQGVIAAAPTDFGLTSGNATAISASYDDWHAAYVLATDESTRTKPTIASKDAEKSSALALMRPFAVAISMNPAVTDENKAAAGVTIRKTVPTPIPPPTTVPAFVLVSAIHLATQLAYGDPSTPDTKAKPFGAIGVEIWQSIGTVFGTDPEQASYVGTWTKSPNTLEYAPDEVGKKVTVWGRWVTRGGVGGKAMTGPWSSPLNFSVL